VAAAGLSSSQLISSGSFLVASTGPSESLPADGTTDMPASAVTSSGRGAKCRTRLVEILDSTENENSTAGWSSYCGSSSFIVYIPLSSLNPMAASA